ncbi:hypothetical protein NC653_036553 [Populus alba x Populus x berolinensis]|uniref:Uncharacterized protein n=1 Tax=Populus alba x Populus x berolinensis TaxID=444605 RepID=A0AAD6PV17_9ROSI|nr:hypothetical protein NC653_036553 [Populus alba x Populus x berolinensis]
MMKGRLRMNGLTKCKIVLNHINLESMRHPRSLAINLQGANELLKTQQAHLSIPWGASTANNIKETVLIARNA